MQKEQGLDLAYVILTSTFCVFLIATNLLGLKIFAAPLGNVALTSGILIYPFTFVLSDSVTEIYGKKRANFMVYLGFFLSLLTLGMIHMIINLPPHPYWIIPDNPYGYKTMQAYQNAFAATFGMSGVAILASMLAFLTAQLVDILLFQKIKQMTRGKYLWLRNNISTILAQLIDTMIVCGIVFYFGFHMEFEKGLKLQTSIYFYKVLLCILSTPLTYLCVKVLKKEVPMFLSKSRMLPEAVE